MHKNYHKMIVNTKNSKCFEYKFIFLLTVYSYLIILFFDGSIYRFFKYFINLVISYNSENLEKKIKKKFVFQDKTVYNQRINIVINSLTLVFIKL